MKHLLALLVFFGFFYSCDDCNDCLDLTAKNILVVDAFGNNLLFGDNAVFNAEDITILGGEVSQPLLIDENTQSLQFFLEEGITVYTLQLDANTTDTIAFDLSERDSERCCGTQTFSTATRINGETIQNTDTITIVK